MTKNYKFLYSAAMMVLMTAMSGISTYAAPVSPQQASAEAIEFLRKGASSMVMKAPASNDVALARTYSENSTDCFYVFNYDQGFVIISADDRLPAVLGYSDNGAFDESRIPENMKWWLSNYSAEISQWIPTAPDSIDESAAGRSPISRISRKAIEPLLTTKWDQTAPYNNDCPLDRNNNRCVTGCVATATAQIMKYHQWPLQPEGSNNGVIFNGTTYDWRNMIDVYTSGQYNSSQAAAVAKLMYQVGVSVNMMYSAWASGAYDYDVAVALPKYFKYSENLRTSWKDYTPQKEWNNLIYSELAAGRPVYYSGSSSQGGHAFVCDGYSENEYFHFNWGWGGYEDGYFLLSALNPASGGAGSYEGGYNSNQTIITGIMPASDSEKATKQCELLSTGGFYHKKDFSFEVRNGFSDMNLIYNPMGYEEKLNLGLRIEGIDNPAYVEYATVANNYSLQSFFGVNEIGASFPDLEDGNYRVTPAFSDATSASPEWQPVKIMLGKQNYVLLTVKNGEYTFQNLGPDKSYSPHLIFGDPEFTSPIYADTQISVRIPVLNVGSGDFTGYIGVSLFDANDEFGDIASYNENFSIAAESYSDLDVIFYEGVKAGTYKVSIIDNNNNIYGSDMRIKVENGNFPTIENAKLEIDEIYPGFYKSGSASPIYFSAYNPEGTAYRLQFKIQFLDIKTKELRSELPGGTRAINIPGRDRMRVAINPLDFNLSPGQYLMRITDNSGNPLATPTPLIVTSSELQSDGISYIITDETSKSAIITAPANTPYSGNVVIPSKVKGYDVTALRPDAFTFATASNVTLPGVITHIPAGTFYCAKQLKTLNLEASDVVTAAAEAFDSSIAANCWLYVNDNLANLYKFSSSAWTPFLMPRWGLHLTDVEISNGFDINAATGLPYSPYYTGIETPYEITLSAPAGKNVRVHISHNGNYIFSEVIDPTKTRISLPALGLEGIGEIYATATDQEVSVSEISSEAEIVDVFSIDGRIILRQASAQQIAHLPAGIYILSSGKKFIKR